MHYNAATELGIISAKAMSDSYENNRSITANTKAFTLP